MSGLESMHRRLTVDLGAIAANLAQLRGVLPQGAAVAAVVKADAYGHGAVEVARLLKDQGAEGLAVADMAEARRLRQAGLEGPLFLLLGIWPDQAMESAELELTPVVHRLEVLEALAQAGRGQGRLARCQIKVDTGMGRLGVTPTEALELLEAARGLEGLDVTGLVSHLATGGEPGSEHARQQDAAFAQVLAMARERGHALNDSSLCGSGGALVPPGPGAGHLGWARLGISLYGGLPAQGAKGRAELRPAMSYTCRLIAVKKVEAGAPVSYGCTWHAPQATWLGVLPVGYADGYPRSLSNQGRVLVGGRRVPVRGRVCMNLTVVELGPETGARVGDEAVLLGRQGGEEIGPDELAGMAGTISYELCCSLGAANPRHHLPA